MNFLLEVKSIFKHFEGVTAISDLSFSVKRNTIKAVIGPNGAGKTTLINLISGVYPPSMGEIYFKGRAISGLKPHQLCSLGIARTFQTIELFKNMTALENVMVGCHSRGSKGIVSSALRLRGVNKEEIRIREKAFEYLRVVGLEKYANQKAGTLPFGIQRLLEIARALASEPQLLLFDEPAAGLNEAETRDAGELILRIRDLGKTIILIEHDMKMVMSVSDEVLVMNYGRKIFDGIPLLAKQDSHVLEAYLGKRQQNA